MLPESYWRREARKVIQDLVVRYEGLADEDLRKVISAAYPFGERRLWPYKCWLREVKEFFSGYEGDTVTEREEKEQLEAAGQERLFKED